MATGHFPNCSHNFAWRGVINHDRMITLTLQTKYDTILPSGYPKFAYPLEISFWIRSLFTHGQTLPGRFAIGSETIGCRFGVVYRDVTTGSREWILVKTATLQNGHTQNGHNSFGYQNGHNQNGHTVLVKTATQGGSLPKRPNCIWSKRPQREDHYQNGHTAFGQNGHKGRITTKTATLHLVKTAAQERPLPKRPHCIWSKRPHREGDHWISCQASVTHAGVLARMQQGPFLGRY